MQHLYIKHASKLTPDEEATVRRVLGKPLGKFSKMSGASRLTVEVDVHRAAGSRKKYSMKAVLRAPGASLRASCHGWDVSRASNDVVEMFRKQIAREKLKRKSRERKDRRAAK